MVRLIIQVLYRMVASSKFCHR